MLSPDFRKCTDAASKHVPHYWFIYCRLSQFISQLLKEAFSYETRRQRFLVIDLKKKNSSSLLQNEIFTIPQETNIVHANNNVTIDNACWIFVVFLTYMTDGDFFFEWLVNVKVLHRLRKKRRISTLNSFLKSVLIVVIIPHLFTLVRFKQFFESQDEETDGHTELKG